MSLIQLETQEKKLTTGNSVLVIEGRGVLTSADELQKVEKYFNDCLQHERKYIIFDVTQVTNISSAGMGLIIKLIDTFNAKRGSIVFIGMTEKVIALFEMLGLLSLIEAFEDEKAALAYLETIGEVSSTPDSLTDTQIKSIHEVLKSGKKIEAIKLYRNFTGLGLTEAKGFIDELHASLQSEYPEQFPQTQATGCLVIFILASLGYFLY